MPRLSKLQGELAKEGLVVVGISTEELDVVKKWLTDNPKLEVDYTLAVDPGGIDASPYKDRAGTIPYAFVIDRTGTVIWQGHPLGGLERVVREALAGTHDAAKARKIAELRKKFEAAARIRDVDALLESTDELIAADPTNPRNYEVKALILKSIGKPSEVPAVRKAMVAAVAEDPDGLSKAALALATDEVVATRDPALALEAAMRAVEISKRSDAGALSRSPGSTPSWACGARPWRPRPRP
jgi:hypothetical protein